MVADEIPIDEILELYPDLGREDVVQALRYAAYVSGDREVELVRPE
jgi:uncharacterized protein (DUF433 family)